MCPLLNVFYNLYTNTFEADRYSLLFAVVQITDKLLVWYELNRRDLPWRNSSNPYHIWLSEIILQQTRVEQGMPYYFKFIEAFPTVCDLAAANEQSVLKLWQGLGYYSRALNLHQTAQLICCKYEGVFPNTYAELIALKGIGPYTAAAIASIAFQQVEPVIDGNVYRFLSRLYALSTPVPSSYAHKQFREVALELFTPGTSPGHLNQALMEMGALICTPQNPDCENCPVAEHCIAYAKNEIHKYPVKKLKNSVKEVEMHFAVIETPKGMVFEKRNHSSIWKGLYQPLLVENPISEPQKTIQWLCDKLGIGHPSLTYTQSSAPFIHLLSHRRLLIRFHHFVSTEHIHLPERVSVYNYDELKKLPFPIVIAKYFLA